MKNVNRRNPLLALVGILFLSSAARCQNVVILILDGARYSETIGADSLNMPHLWTQLRPQGTIWTNFRNEGLTKTAPGHASIATGSWQSIDNKGIYRPSQPTIFEYFRKATGASKTDAALFIGKDKLHILAYSSHADYGKKYKAMIYSGEDDTSVSTILKTMFFKNHPRIAFVNFPSIDEAGHSGNWALYLSAIHTADSLVYDLWQTLQADSLYHNKTTLFITNDHGRHDDVHGGFIKHGDACEGCRHIMLLAIGRGFSAGKIIDAPRTQCDIVPTAGELLSFPTFYSSGVSLLRDTLSTP
jgi:predicted AlkP superfamily pyrophosphatase or phosphodiesterase